MLLLTTEYYRFDLDINLHKHIHTYIYTLTYRHTQYIHTFIHTYIHAYIRTYTTYIHRHTHISIIQLCGCVHVWEYVCMHVCMYVSMYVCMYVYVCECVCMYVCACVLYVCMYVCTSAWRVDGRLMALDFLPCPRSYYYAATCKVVCSLAPSCRYHLRSIRLFSRRQFLSGALYLELYVVFFHFVYQTTDQQHCYVS